MDTEDKAKHAGRIQEALERLASRPTVSVVDAGVLLELGRNAAYEAVKRGEIDALRVGKSIRIKSAPLRQKLGLQAA
jgi:excisionase family DNA binding protein